MSVVAMRRVRDQFLRPFLAYFVMPEIKSFWLLLSYNLQVINYKHTVWGGAGEKKKRNSTQMDIKVVMWGTEKSHFTF